MLPIRHRGVINSQHALNIHHRRAVDCLHITQERMLFEHAASNYGFKTIDSCPIFAILEISIFESQFDHSQTTTSFVSMN